VRVIALIFLLAGSLTAVGCNAVGALSYKLGPPPMTDAKYVPQKDLAVVVVENFRNPGSSEIDSEQLARLIADEFRKNEVVPLVDDNAVSNLRDKDPKKFHTMSIPAIGRAVGAKQVFYVDLQAMVIDMAVGENLYKGSMNTTVRVVDVESTHNRWPTDAQQGWPVNLQTPLTQTDPSLTEGKIRRQMNESMAINIAHLFYKWYNVDEGSEIGRD